MEKEDKPVAGSPDKRVAENTERYQSLLRRLVAALADKPVTNQKLEAPGMDMSLMAFQAWMNDCFENPEKAYKRQFDYWQETAKNYFSAQQSAFAGMMEAWPTFPDNNAGAEKKGERLKDRRFSSPHWDSNPWLQFVRDQYLTTSQMASELVASLENVEEADRSRLEFFSRQIADMFAPTNFLAYNPDALKKAYDTKGNSLLDGFENFVRDVEANKGRHSVVLSDNEAFEVGVNIAATPGKVVFQNRMFELIQYAPSTKQVYEKPLVIIPPWINKFYILDLKPQNSFIKYAVDAGFTVFVVSWVNPDGSYRDTGFEDYVHDGAVKAIETVCEVTGQSNVNAIGYCIGGTLLATTLALLAKEKRDLVASATFFTTLVNFEKPGEITAFFDGAMLDGLEEEIERQGYLDAYYMARAFSYLRANDLVYGPGVKSYLMGEKPPAFDLLYWNGDSTNLPAKMARQYLDRLYNKNELMQGSFSIGDKKLNLADVNIPVTAVATRTDHIAPWVASFSGLSTMSGDVRFILSDSGHIAGIVNPPSANKYCYWLNEAEFEAADAEKWFEGADRHEGSWWPVWTDWLEKHSGKKIEAREPGSKKHPAISDAPGSYVKVRA